MGPPVYGSKGMHARPRSDATLDTTWSSTTDEDSNTSCPSVPTEESSERGRSGTMGGTTTGRFIVKLTPLFVVVALILSTMSAFSVGTMCHNAILSTSMQTTNCASSGLDIPDAVLTTKLPTLTHTVHLDRKTSSNNMHNKREVSAKVLSEEGEEEDSRDETYIDQNKLHLPTGQHLLVDIKHVDASFLKLEERLATAMVELINASKLTLLSYQCHSLMPMGVSCAGVLLEGNVALHTWPLSGAIAIDLFTCGPAPLIPVLPIIENLFSIPTSNDFNEYDYKEPQNQPRMIWSHKLRGFRKGFSTSYNPYQNPLDQELGTDFLAKHDLDVKAKLVSEETEFQHVDIYELMDPRLRSLASHERSLLGDGSYESLRPDVFGRNKVLFLDGVQQSSLHGEAAYHEALVHPAMVAHANPRRVAIIGGGEGATLREILKHRTVEEVMMVEIDEELVELCREHLPEWSDCRIVEGSDADSCFDDSRTSLMFEDAFQWFGDAFGGEDENKDDDKFDVIIMDALDPDRFVTIVDGLYKDNDFVDSLYNGLTKDGVYVVQLGESDSLQDPSLDMGPARDTAHMINALQNAGFESMHIYDEGHSHFGAPWSYLVCFKDSKLRSRWYQTAAEIDLKLHERLHRSTSIGKPVLLYFDGPTMISYQLPSKAQQTIYCRGEDGPWECNEYVGIDPEAVNMPMSHLEVRKSTIPNGGRGLFAAQDIPEGAGLLMNIAIQSFHILPSTWSVIENLREWSYKNYDYIPFVEQELFSLCTFTEGYGYVSTLLGKTHYTVDSGISTFCNHGCNGTYTYGDDDANFSEMDVDLYDPPETVLNKANIYSPVFERHLRQILSVGDKILRDIKKDEEIFCNYLSYVGDPDNWEEDVGGLRSQCAGETMGEILQYELEENIQ